MKATLPYSRFNRKTIERAKLRCDRAYKRLARLQPGTSQHGDCERIIIKLQHRVEFLQEQYDWYWNQPENANRR